MSKFGQQARFLLVLILTLALSIVVMYVNITNGTFDISVMDVLRTIFRVQTVRDYDLVIFDFRLPRIVIGALVGFALGIAGAVLQGITRNELADPGILGIHSAAGMAIVLYMFFIQDMVKGASWLSIMTMPIFGWLGGMAAALLLLLFARHRGVLDPQRLILVGIALSSGFGAMTLYISLKMDPQDFEMATVWLAGSIYNATWIQILALLPWIIILIPIIWWRSHTLNLLHLDEASVSGLGLNKNRERMIFLLCCVGLVSACVSVSGSIGFVGLIAPHIARKLVGLRYKYIVPVCGAIGMLMVLVGDFIGKTIFSPAELPAGIVISIVGVPYFVYLLFKKKN
ncbi:FecCD family ABC transporter permease [Paenibacillus sp. IHBB 10380]|uniref:FecCD family ABC transporter permease n=1 Tax=Paenibacillus sp. IHBB 10380 TaxID=1566358 RepID=UPI0005CFBB47|nr:iron ABC transporter permease [Paenibacillus sp. IHBB 10380]